MASEENPDNKPGEAADDPFADWAEALEEQKRTDDSSTAEQGGPLTGGAAMPFSGASNDAPAQDMLSWMLLEGEVMPADVVAAREWAEKAAEKDIASSMTRLGMIYHNALGVERDPALAASWWIKAAELGDFDGKAMLGAAHVMGAGVSRDAEKALTLLLIARKGGSELADRFIDAARNSLSAAQVAAIERAVANNSEPVT